MDCHSTPAQQADSPARSPFVDDKLPDLLSFTGSFIEHDIEYPRDTPGLQSSGTIASPSSAPQEATTLVCGTSRVTQGWLNGPFSMSSIGMCALGQYSCPDLQQTPDVSNIAATAIVARSTHFPHMSDRRPGPDSSACPGKVPSPCGSLECMRRAPSDQRQVLCCYVHTGPANGCLAGMRTST